MIKYCGEIYLDIYELLIYYHNFLVYWKFNTAQAKKTILVAKNTIQRRHFFSFSAQWCILISTGVNACRASFTRVHLLWNPLLIHYTHRKRFKNKGTTWCVQIIDKILLVFFFQILKQLVKIKINIWYSTK